MNALIAFCLERRLVVAVLLLMFLGAGVIAFRQLNIEAYPDPVPPLIDIVTQSSGQSAQEIERYITIPLEVQLAGIPHVTSVRTISLFGLSDVTVQFTFEESYETAKQRVLNRLSQLAPLPNGAQPGISPESPIGEIYRYRVVGPPGYSVTDLKTIQDWMLERRFKSVPGVIDVTGWGGMTKQYDVDIDLGKLEHYGLSVPQVLQALNNADINVGGQTLNLGAQSAVVRGVGLINSMDDIRDSMIAVNNGAPVLVRDVATVSVGHLPRLGIAGQDGDDDIVQGIVLMRRGEQSTPTIQRVEAEVGKINASGILPPGVSIRQIYDRSELIAITTRTVVENLLMGIVLIFLVQWVFLGNLRSAIVVSATIPFALFFAVGIMIVRGESANLLSVGAIDFGLIVEATVIMVENIFRHLAEARADAAHGKLGTIRGAAREVNRAIFFSAAIIIASFVPLFTLSGVEGHIFGPMARTYAYAILGGLIATFTVSPALCAMLLPARVEETETLAVRWMRRMYAPLFAFAERNRLLTLGGALLLAGAALLALRGLGVEFLPKLEEGNLWIRATMPSAVSLEGSNGYVNAMRRLIKSYPEVRTVVSQHGRPDDGTDTTGFFNAEFFVPLKPFGEWPSGVDKAELVKRMSAALEEKFPGVDFNFSQYIEDNVEEAESGVKGENSIKLYGNDLNTLQSTAEKIEAVMQTVPGITDLSIFTEVGQPTVNITVDRARAARFGLAPGDINAVVQTAIGGQAAGNLYESGSDRNFPIVVRLAQDYRGDLDAIRHIPVGAPNPNGSGGSVQIPLGDVATVELVSGASFIYRENQERYIPIKFSVRGRDLGSAVHEAQAKLDAQVKLPAGYRMEWAGELGELNDAMARLAIVVPLSLGLIGLLLYFHFGSMRDTLIAASLMPMALVGGIFALFVTGTPFSVSAAIGFIGLFGVSVMGGIIVLSHYNRLIDAGMERGKAILDACNTQLRPVMMTCNAACVGLLPAALSTGIGSQVQKPLAIVVVGGILFAPALILGLLPLLIERFSRHGMEGAVAATAQEATP